MMFFRFLLPVIALLAFCSCGRMIFDDEVSDDCDPKYRVRFVYDWNMKWADAFPAEVNAVTLHVVDQQTGRIVWSVTESGERLREEGYMIDVPVEPGNYKLLAWCGDGHLTHFQIPQTDHHTGLTCTMDTEADDDGGKHSRRNLDRLYHGHLDNQVFPAEYGTYTYTVALVKDTNEINVVLQHLSGQDVNPADYHFSITDDNSMMDWDNSLIPAGEVTYHAHDVQSGTAGVEIPDTPQTRTLTSVSAVVAALSTPRLVKGQDMRLHIHRNDESAAELVNVPVIDYSLLVKGFNFRNLDDQEYLDREDKYDLVFFLDESENWTEISLFMSNIFINSWRIVKNSHDL